MPSAPAAMASLAARTGSGWRPPRALRMVATWSTLMPRRKRGGLIYLTVDPFRLRHHRFGAQLRDDVGEMLEVVDLQIDQHIGEVRRPPRHADIVDIAVVLGDHLCNLGERAGLVPPIGCLSSYTSRSISTSLKSGARLVMRILSILPSCSAITCAIWANEPGSFTDCTAMRAGKRRGVLASSSQRTSSQRSGLSSNSLNACDWIG